jgi:hypothetical protein
MKDGMDISLSERKSENHHITTPLNQCIPTHNSVCFLAFDCPIVVGDLFNGYLCEVADAVHGRAEAFCILSLSLET